MTNLLFINNGEVWFFITPSLIEKNYFLTSNILFSVKLVFSLLQTANKFACEILLQIVEPTTTQLLATHFYFPSKNFLKSKCFISVVGVFFRALKLRMTRGLNNSSKSLVSCINYVLEVTARESRAGGGIFESRCLPRFLHTRKNVSFLTTKIKVS